jgi:hypothetical protein
MTLENLYPSFSLDFGKGAEQPSSSSAQLNELLAPLTIRRLQSLSSLTLKRHFDQVWPKSLLHNLRSLSVTHGLYNVLKSFLNGRVFSMRLRDVQSPLRSLSAGPTGPLFSPLLYVVNMRCVVAVPTLAHESPSTLMKRAGIPLRSLPPCYTSIYSAILTPWCLVP